MQQQASFHIIVGINISLDTMKPTTSPKILHNPQPPPNSRQKKNRSHRANATSIDTQILDSSNPYTQVKSIFNGWLNGVWIPVELITQCFCNSCQRAKFGCLPKKHKKKPTMHDSLFATTLRFRTQRSRMIMIQVVLQFWHFAEPTGRGRVFKPK